jgi:hypothetical protein
MIRKKWMDGRKGRREEGRTSGHYIIAFYIGWELSFMLERAIIIVCGETK